MDSLEETLQELEAALSGMGANTVKCLSSSPQPPPPRPQVAASRFSPGAFLLQSGGLQSERVRPQELCPPPSFPLSFVSASHPPGARFQARAYGQSQGRPGSRPTQDSALLLGREPGGLCPCLLSVSQRIKLSPLLHPFLPSCL